MPWPRNNRLEEMYALYCEGKSLAEVARVFGYTRQSVFCVFKYNGKKTRPKRNSLEFVEFNGNKYTIRNNGYYGRTNKERSLLHRDVWEHFNGPIPPKYDIHHINGNKLDNRIENLECLPKAEHTRKYSPHNNQYTKGRKKR